MTDLERFMQFVTPSAPDECWPWRGSITRTTGYGSFRFDGRAHPAHRIAYTLLIGPIPDGLHIDHTCRNRACVNPAHLEPVTNRENGRRGVVARLGREPFSCTHVEGGRGCPVCARARAARWRAAVRAGKVALKVIVCVDCGDEMPNCARGLCRRCYTRWYRRSKAGAKGVPA